MKLEFRKVFNQIFRPHDGSARAVQAAVEFHVGQTVAASNDLIETVRELMERNDNITGRKFGNNVQKIRKQ